MEVKEPCVKIFIYRESGVEGATADIRGVSGLDAGHHGR